MPKVSPTQHNFTSGEISPRLYGRYDIDKYSHAAKTLKNILIHQAGSGQRRPGTKFVAEVKTSSLKTRLITFEFSTTQTYILEFGNQYIRFYRNQGQIQSASAYEISTPYLTAELFDLQFAQDADTMFITHPNWKPRELTRTGHTAWTLKNYAPELLTLDVAPGGAGWAAGETITGNTSGKTSIIVEVLTTTTYRIKNRDGAYTLGEVLTNGTATADQGAANPVASGDPFGADASDDCPSCVAMFEQRIQFGNTNNNPQRIWASKSGDFQDMTVGTDAGDAYIYTIASDKVNAVRWLKPIGKSLQMGTLGATFSLSSGNDALAITPTNVSIKRDTTYGAANILPETIGNFIYYVGRDLNHLRELGFSFDIDAQQALDMTILSDHIAKAADPLDSDGFTQIAYQQSPVSRLWCVRNDGQLAVLTRQIDQEVLGWSRQISGNDSRDSGKYESVAVIPTDGGDDEVWVIVKRYINGSTVRYVEYFTAEVFDHQQDAFFVDSGLSLDSPKTITNVVTKTVIDDMEYPSDTAAQNAYVSNDTGPDSFTKLLLRCNGQNGGIVFTDEAGKTVTAVGDAQLDTAQKKFGTASGLFDGTGDYLSVPDSGDWNFGTGDFTIDLWTRFTNATAANNELVGQRADANNRWIFMVDITNLVFNLYTGSATATTSLRKTHTMSNNTWHHIALVRSGNTFTLYQDGVSLGSVTSTDSIADLAAALTIGFSDSDYFTGHLDEIRISKGIARWTANFTPPTAEYPQNLQSFSEVIIKQQGASSLKVVALETGSLSNTLTRTLSSTVDLSGINSIKLDARALRTGNNFKIGFHDSGGVTTEHTINIIAADTFQTDTIDISAVADGDKDAIDSIIITILNADADNTIYIDNIFGLAAFITITAATHTFVDDDEIRIVDVIGTTELNDSSFIVDKIDANSFSIKDSGGNFIDGSGFTTYISGGEARKKATTITGLTHLVGEEVAILAEGAPVATKIVDSSGEITLDAAASLVHAGLPFVSDIGLLPFPEGSATGTAIGKVQRIYKLIVKLFESLDFQFGPDEDNLDTETQETLFTGDKIIEFPGDWNREGLVLIRQSQPLPLNILSITLISEIVDD